MSLFNMKINNKFFKIYTDTMNYATIPFTLGSIITLIVIYFKNKFMQYMNWNIKFNSRLTSPIFKERLLRKIPGYF